jgi:sigma-B regulation protein RsbU (phosphoserine phosphatase)
MPPDDDTLEEQTLSFQQPEGALPESGTGDPVHLLLLLDDNAPPKRFPLHSLPVVIGRNPPADLLLEGTTVSRRHCRLEQLDGALRLIDLASTNGTFVNGVRLTESATLEDGATIGVGVYRLRYHRRNKDETADADAMEQEWRDAGQYVASILPRPIHDGPVRAAWFYQPSTRIGGDAFGYQMLDDRHFSLFLLDVSGHGTGAAMHAMTVAQVLRERVLPDVDFLDPAAVISGLNARFQMHRNNDLFFTIWYGVYDIVERVLIFAAAGHHAAYLLPADNAAWAPLPLLTKNPVVGMLPDPLIAAAEVEVPAGGTLHLFSDGVFEIIDRQGRQLGLEDIVAMLPVVASNEAAGDPKGGDPKGGDPKGGDPKGGDPGRDDPRRLYDRVRAIARPGQLDDDFSALVFRFP